MITHKIINTDTGIRYLCNQACYITKDKLRIYWSEVTCKNCRKHIKNNIFSHRKLSHSNHKQNRK